MPVREFVRGVLRCSERHYYHLNVFRNHELIKWDTDILNGKYGRVGTEFLAEVCQYGDASGGTVGAGRARKCGRGR
jgi:hypothetical protein